MTISQHPFVLSETTRKEVIPAETIRYFQRLLENRFHELILEAFIEQEKRFGLTQKQLATRIGRDPAQVTRWLNTTGNLTIDTISDLLLGMGVDLDDLSFGGFDELVPQEERPLPVSSAPNPIAQSERNVLANQVKELLQEAQRCSGATTASFSQPPQLGVSLFGLSE